MATLQQIRDGLKTRLLTIAALTDHVHTEPPGSVVLPAAVIYRAQTQYDRTFDGADDHTMAITIGVTYANNPNAGSELDAFVDASGTNSVAAAVHADPTLGGIVGYARVVSVDPDDVKNIAGVESWGATFTIEVGA